MQDKKEHSTGFVKNIWNKLHDWWISFEYRHLWTARLIVYFTCLAAVVSVCFYLFQYFNLFHTDANSARYMLSALVQSQAAIVAIVITLTLIAVQLTASAYSPRVIDIFKKNPDMWLLLGCYGVSIFFGFIVLKLVVGAEGEAVSQSVIWSFCSVSISFEFCVSLAYWLGAFTFVALFPYMWDIIRLLKSENIIKRLAIEITKNKSKMIATETSEDTEGKYSVLSVYSVVGPVLYSYTDKILKPKEDPVQPIMDIVYGSIMKYDLETARIGLKAVTDQVIKVIDFDNQKAISMFFCNHLTRVSRLAISREDEESTVEVIEKLKNFGKSAVKKELGAATWHATRSLGEVGKAVAEKGLEVGTWHAAGSLGAVGKAVAEKGLGYEASNAAESLGAVGKAAAEKGLEVGTYHAAGSLGAVGKAAAEKGLEEATKQAVVSLGKVGKASAEKDLGDATRKVVVSLRKVGSAAAEKGLEDAAWDAAEFLEAVGKYAMEKGLEGTKLEVIESLYALGQNFMGKGLETATVRVIKALLAVRQIAEKVVASDLASLTLLNEEIVKTAIQDYESGLKEQDRNSFQKFMEIYKQKLENCEPRNDAKILKAYSRT